jgi:hypothetical protein
MVMGVYRIDRGYVDSPSIVRNLRGEGFSAWVENGWNDRIMGNVENEVIVTNADRTMIAMCSSIINPIDVIRVGTL